MPEGPEVRRCGDQLRSLISGKQIKWRAVSGKLGRNGIKLPPAYATVNTFNVEDVQVRGKVIFIKSQQGLEIVSTLGMSGWWYPPQQEIDLSLTVYYQGKPQKATDVAAKALKHTRVTIEEATPTKFSTDPFFDPLFGGVKRTTRIGTPISPNQIFPTYFTGYRPLAHYIDPRNFGNLKIVTDKEADRIRASLGIDLLNDEVTLYRWLNIFTDVKLGHRQIGEVLLDQKVICGIGNIYRAEILYLSRVHPASIIAELTEAHLIRIYDCAKLVLNTAYVNYGNMKYELDDPVRGQINIDGFAVYGRKRDVFQHTVCRAEIGGRTMWYVPEVQTLIGPEIRPLIDTSA